MNESKEQTTIEMTAPVEAPAASPTGNCPPQAPLALRIGVAGHRPDVSKRPNPDVLATRLAIVEVLKTIQSAFAGVARVGASLFVPATNTSQGNCQHYLRAISSLAEGADQWVADEALKLGFELQCPLPFERAEYRKDFPDPAVAAEFDRLLGQATAVLELDGKVNVDEYGGRVPDSRAYEACNRAVLNQTDLLVAVWDGQPARGRGGTGQVVEEALQRGIPVIWIPWGTPTRWRLQLPMWHLMEEPGDITGDVGRLTKMVRELLLPPEGRSCRDRAEDLREVYFHEGQKHGNFQHGCWQLFRSIICGEFFTKKGLKDFFCLKAFRVGNFIAINKAQAEREWVKKQSVKDALMDHPLPVAVRTWVDKAFLPHYAWANGLSVYYGNLYRSAFLLNFLLGALAVFLALICFAAGIEDEHQSAFIVGELVVILGIIVLTRIGSHRRWHQRWIDYRTLAERLRLARCTSLFGGGGPQVIHAGHLASYGNPARTWMHWHYRAIERAAGLLAVPGPNGSPAVQFNKPYLLACQEFWRESLVEDQSSYHKLTRSRLIKLDHRLHRSGDLLFGGTLVACALHLTVEHDTTLSNCLTLLCAFLPALGAALAGIRSQGETQRLAQRSEAMEASLRRLEMDLVSLPIADNQLHSQRLRECTDRVSDLMIKEMLDWRVVFQDRPLVLPV